jgi:hypothetical protein
VKIISVPELFYFSAALVMTGAGLKKQAPRVARVVAAE